MPQALSAFNGVQSWVKLGEEKNGTPQGEEGVPRKYNRGEFWSIGRGAVNRRNR